MDLNLAKAILLEAVAGEYLDEVPESEEEILEQAAYYAEEAEKAYNEGWGKNNEHIKAIVKLSSEEPANSPSFAQQENGVGSGSSAFFKGLPLPQGVEEEPVEMPYNVSSLTDEDVRRYHGIFNHYYGRVRYSLAEENAKLVAAEHLRDDAFRKAFLKVKQRETAGTIKAQEAEAMEDQEFISWNRNVLDHEKNVLKLKALAEIYSKNVEVLSREATIRQNEYERSR